MGEPPMGHMAGPAMPPQKANVPPPPASPASSRWTNLDAILSTLAEADPVFAPLCGIAPPAGFRMVGQRIPRQSHRYSGRTAITAHLDVHEPKPPQDEDTPLSFSMEGSPLQPPSALIPRFWAPGWNSVQSINKFQIEVGGPLHGGDPGRRLIEPPTAPAGAVPAYFSDVPPAFAPRGGRWWVVPAQHIFGSEELSVHSPGIRQLAPRPYAALNAADAAELGLRDGQDVAIMISGRTWRLPLRAGPSLPPGVAAIPCGLPELAGLALPAWAALSPAGNAGGRP